MDDIAHSARERIDRARQQAGGSPWLVGYDVVGIQEYVTANSRPLAMRGASAIIKDFDGAQRAGGALFAGGGRGMWLVSAERAARLVEELPRTFADKTVTGVLVAASVPWDAGRERDSLRWLKHRLTAAKDAAAAPRDDLPAGKAEQCERCRAYRSVEDRTVGDEVERLCARCVCVTKAGITHAKQAHAQGLSLTELSGRSFVAAVSADGNNMGRLFDALDSLEAVAALSDAVSKLFQQAHAEALRAAKVERWVDPVTGGDDIRVFLAPRHVAAYVGTLAREVERGASSFGDLGGTLRGEAAKHAADLGVGVGVAVAGDKTSASWMLQRAHDLERTAKERCLASKFRSAVDFVWTTTGEAFLGGASSNRVRSDAGPPISLAEESWSKYLRDVAALREVPPSQRTILSQRTSMGDAEFANLFRYQVARSPKWQRWYEETKRDWRDPQRVVQGIPDGGMLDMLRMQQEEGER